MPKAKHPAAVKPAPQDDHEMPPTDANIPRVPSSFKRGTGTLRGVKPRVAEVNLVVDAVAELRAFHDYDAVFGRTASKYEVLLHTFECAAAWSSMRVAMVKWDEFCRAMEELSWRKARVEMKRFKPAFGLAAEQDERLKHRLPNTAFLLGAMTDIARKGVSSRKANQQAEAEGRTPLRGKLAKRAQRAAAKAAVAAASERVDVTYTKDGVKITPKGQGTKR